MQKTLEIKMTADEAGRMEAAIKQYDKSIRRLFKVMEKDQAEIEKLKAQTRMMLAEMKAA